MQIHISEYSKYKIASRAPTANRRSISFTQPTFLRPQPATIVPRQIRPYNTPIASSVVPLPCPQLESTVAVTPPPAPPIALTTVAPRSATGSLIAPHHCTYRCPQLKSTVVALPAAPHHRISPTFAVAAFGSTPTPSSTRPHMPTTWRCGVLEGPIRASTSRRSRPGQMRRCSRRMAFGWRRYRKRSRRRGRPMSLVPAIVTRRRWLG